MDYGIIVNSTTIFNFNIDNAIIKKLDFISK